MRAAAPVPIQKWAKLSHMRKKKDLASSGVKARWFAAFKMREVAGVAGVFSRRRGAREPGAQAGTGFKMPALTSLTGAGE